MVKTHFKKTLVLFCMISLSFFIPGPAGVSAGDKINIKLAHTVPVSHAYHKGYLKFKEMVEKQTDGNVTVTIFPHGTLGGDIQAADSVQMGIAQMALTGTFGLYDYNPKWAVLDLPYLFDSYADVDKIITGPIGEELLSEPVGQAYVLGFMENGFRHVSNNKRPIKSLADMKGLKIRTMEAPVHVSAFKAMGASPTPMPFGELYTAMQTGVVDGEENPPSLFYAMKFYEVQKYFSLTRHVYLAGLTLINKPFFDSLPADVQDIIKTSFTEAAEFQRALVRKDDAKKLSLLETKLKVNEVPEEEIEKMKEATSGVYKEWAGKIGTGFLNRTLEELGQSARF
ncbi:MAG: TRAP transporter substrate-binding protein [Desulfotignum sp.]|nr:TRAP transporter substrate-binding protein [Desulfotignum sp.]MCF8126287.1 TRAP transporter substrate-binding protein [Desulfotignum sp.]